MQYGYVISGGDVRFYAELAVEAETAGWDAIFVYDSINIVADSEPGYDPWVALASMAMRTERVKLGAMLTPPSRRRPWKLARELATLDLISNGRALFPVGLGALDDGGFTHVSGEATDRKERAELLDESLDIIAGLWRGQPFAYEGKHYQVKEMRFIPPPVQQRIPIWVVGMWGSEKSMARAVRWDGLLPNKPRGEGKDDKIYPADIKAMADWVRAHRTADTPFDIVMEGVTPGDDPAKAAAQVREFAEAGATWWIEADWQPPVRGNYDLMLQRIQQGPPRI